MWTQKGRFQTAAFFPPQSAHEASSVPLYLVVERQLEVGQKLMAILRRALVRAELARACGQARARLERGDYAGVVMRMGAGLPVLEFLAQLRNDGLGVPAFVAQTRLDRRTAARLAELSACTLSDREDLLESLAVWISELAQREAASAPRALPAAPLSAVVGEAAPRATVVEHERVKAHLNLKLQSSAGREVLARAIMDQVSRTGSGEFALIVEGAEPRQRDALFDVLDHVVKNCPGVLMRVRFQPAPTPRQRVSGFHLMGGAAGSDDELEVTGSE